MEQTTSRGYFFFANKKIIINKDWESEHSISNRAERLRAEDLWCTVADFQSVFMTLGAIQRFMMLVTSNATTV